MASLSQPETYRSSQQAEKVNDRPGSEGEGKGGSVASSSTDTPSRTSRQGRADEAIGSEALYPVSSSFAGLRSDNGNINHAYGHSEEGDCVEECGPTSTVAGVDGNSEAAALQWQDQRQQPVQQQQQQPGQPQWLVDDLAASGIRLKPL